LNNRLLFLFILIPFLTNAQSIKGNITDASSKEPLASVNIYFSGTSKGTITDFNGDFEISYYENSQSVFTVSLLGYVTQTFSDPLNSTSLTLNYNPK